MKSTGCLPDVEAPRLLPALSASALSEGTGASAEVCHCVGCEHTPRYWDLSTRPARKSVRLTEGRQGVMPSITCYTVGNDCKLKFQSYSPLACLLMTSNTFRH